MHYISSIYGIKSNKENKNCQQLTSGIVNWFVTPFAKYFRESKYKLKTTAPKSAGKRCAMALPAPTPTNHTAERYHTVKNIQEELEILINVHIFVLQYVLKY